MVDVYRLAFTTNGGRSMVFSSSVFIVYFLPVVLLVYYGLLRNKRKLQNGFLVIASLFFYAWGEPKFVLVMLLSIAVNWILGILVDYHRGNPKIAKFMVAIGIAFNLIILYLFKYLSFSLETITQMFHLTNTVKQIKLPIGISFFTFQAMSYVIDVYRGNGKVQKNILNLALYISFFPQLIAGPIVRYETVAEQITHRKETANDFYEGFSRFIIGMSKKVLLANTFALFADEMFADISRLSASMAWIGAISYTFQIFFDFSGYSDMAIGLGKMFGFHFLENFHYPYIAKSITEFWRRWHISLGTWFKDYVYIPLGGSRVRKPRLIWNLFVVWMLTGIWHGANWTFFLWGFMYFVLISAEKLTGLDKVNSKAWGSVFRWLYTIFFVVIGWVLFRADSVFEACEYLKVMLGITLNHSSNPWLEQNWFNFFVHFVFAVLFSVPFAPWLGEKTKNNTMLQSFRVMGILILFVLSFASVVSSSHNPFIYFNF